MRASLEVQGVTLDYAVYSTRAQSLRNAVLNAAVGGRLLKTAQDVAVVRALSNVSFKLREGDRLALVGHNGSGKTSMLKVLAGVYEPNQGRVDVVGKLISMISMSIGLDGEASGIQNIRNLAMMQMISSKEIDRRLPSIVEFSDLGAFIHMPFRTYSAGMMARLVFAVATSLSADVIVMDEWIGAGDASFQEKAAARVSSFVDQASIVVLATHDPGLVHKVCNRVCELEAGQVAFLGTTEEWLARRAAA